MGVRSNINEFIVKSRNKHGVRYDYNLVDYVDSKTKVKIICDIHGVFEQKANNHLNGLGCYKCGRISYANKRRKLVDNFIIYVKIKNLNQISSIEVILILSERIY